MELGVDISQLNVVNSIIIMPPTPPVTPVAAPSPGFPWARIEWGIAGAFALGMASLGAALTPTVMLGLIGMPLAGLGILLSAATAPWMIRVEGGTARRTGARFLAVLTGLAAGDCPLAYTLPGAQALLDQSRGQIPFEGFLVVHLLKEQPWLFLLVPLLGLITVGMARGRDAWRESPALVLWAGTTPLAIILLETLHRLGLIALSA